MCSIRPSSSSLSAGACLLGHMREVVQSIGELAEYLQTPVSLSKLSSVRSLPLGTTGNILISQLMREAALLESATQRMMSMLSDDKSCQKILMGLNKQVAMIRMLVQMTTQLPAANDTVRSTCRHMSEMILERCKEVSSDLKMLHLEQARDVQQTVTAQLDASIS